LAIAAAAGIGWLFGGITEDIVGHEGLARDETHWHEFDHRLPALSDLCRALTYLGSTSVAYLLLVISVVLVIWRERFWHAAVAVPALIIGELLCAGLAVLVHRQRPPQSDWLTSAYGHAFPSGGAATSVLVWGWWSPWLGLGCVAVLTKPLQSSAPSWSPSSPVRREPTSALTGPRTSSPAGRSAACCSPWPSPGYRCCASIS
jgi:hypothetical protein